MDFIDLKQKAHQAWLDHGEAMSLIEFHNFNRMSPGMSSLNIRSILRMSARRELREYLKARGLDIAKFDAPAKGKSAA